jgi:nucleoside-diphosphate-sugar epimerase
MHASLPEHLTSHRAFDFLSYIPVPPLDHNLLMPHSKDFSIDTSKPVLVTGATGYVAGVLIAQLLDEGLTVHATVRDPSRTDRIQYLQDLADQRAHNGSAIKFFGADLLDVGSFDEAATGCSVIFHTASPFAMTAKDPQRDLIDPAVQGTENVLNTAFKTPSVTRVVLTSSVLAIYNHASDGNTTVEQKQEQGGLLDESVWNRTSTLTDNPYNLSKTLAEQKAWVMAGSQTKYKLVVINPGFVLGPGLKYHASSESYGFLKLLTDGTTFAYGVVDIPLAVVDVRDVAAAHIAAAYKEDAAGRNIIVSIGTNALALGRAIAEKFPPPQYPIPTTPLPLPKFLLWGLGPFVGLSRRFVAENVGYELHFDNSKSQTELGMKYLPMNTTVQGTHDLFAHRLMRSRPVHPTNVQPFFCFADMYEQMLALGVVSAKE